MHHKMLPLLHRRKMPTNVAWNILRFTGYVCDDRGAIIGIANSDAELQAIRTETELAHDLAFTGPGFHDEQLSTSEYFAWHRRHIIESAAVPTSLSGGNHVDGSPPAASAVDTLQSSIALD